MLFPLHTCTLTPLHSLKIYFKNHHCKSARVLHHTSLVAQMVKSPPAMQETRVWSLGQEDPLEEEMATHSSVLAWEIPWTEEPGGLQSMGSQRDTTEQLTFSLHFTSARALHHTSPVMGVITVIYRWGNRERLSIMPKVTEVVSYRAGTLCHHGLLWKNRPDSFKVIWRSCLKCF